jgi:hypothetical protein
VRLTVLDPGAAAPRDVELELQDQPTHLTGVRVPILFSFERAPDDHSSKLSILDLWVVSLFEYEREESEREYTLLTLFGWQVFSVSVGEGELAP